jgi:plastocyanin
MKISSALKQLSSFSQHQLMKISVVLLGAGLAVATACAGTITGTVRAQAKEGADQDLSGGKYDSRKYKFAERIDYAALRDFVVCIDQPFTNSLPRPAKPAEVITQKDATFKPHVLPIMVGTRVKWPNYDNIFHNVFSVSETKEFDLDLYKGQAPEEKVPTFDKPGRVDVYCSIHKNMHCIIYVVENPYFALTDAKNQYAITNVPPGKYRLKAWHERMPSQVREVTVPEKGEAKLDFTLGFSTPPKGKSP